MKLNNTEYSILMNMTQRRIEALMSSCKNRIGYLREPTLSEFTYIRIKKSLKADQIELVNVYNFYCNRVHQQKDADYILENFQETKDFVLSMPNYNKE